MSFSLNQSKGSVKLLLQGENRDGGTLQSPTFALNQSVIPPPDSFGLLGIDKIVWMQPPLFPLEKFNFTVTVQTGAVYNYSFVMNSQSINNIGTMTDLVYDGSGGIALSTFLTTFISTMNALSLAAFHTAYPSDTQGTGVTFDFYSTDFVNSTNFFFSTSTNPSTDAKNFANMGHRDLQLCCQARGVMATTYALGPNYGANTTTIVRLTDNVQPGICSQYFGNPVFYPFQSTPARLPTQIPFNGMRFMKVLCDVASGFRESRSLASGLANTTLLGIVPCGGYPGGQEVFVSSNQIEKITVANLSMDSLQFSFLDEQNQPMTALRGYAVVLGVDFMDKDPSPSLPTMGRGRANA